MDILLPQDITLSDIEQTSRHMQKRAISAVGNANRAGTLHRPDICENCGIFSKHIHGHHWRSYHKAHFLDVQWLCVSCHKAVHAYITRRDR